MKELNMMNRNNLINIDFFQEEKIVDENLFLRIFKEIISEEKITKPLKIDLALISDEKMQVLNKKYKQKDEPTDVLAFRKEDLKVKWPKEKKSYLGEIFISFETAKRQSFGKKISFEDEIAFLFIHGLLHLLGYDHTLSKKEAKRMEKKSKTIYNKYIVSSKAFGSIKN